MNEFKKTISCWGNYPLSSSILLRPEKIRELIPQHFPFIPRGLGRSYGDASLNSEHYVILMERMNRFLSFDEKTGLLQAESGVSLKEILDLFVPRGWFLPVTPGTKFTTLGGCVAADVHGKNHHRDGSFSNFVESITLILADGTKKLCSRTQEPDLFWATVGGMGLTGIILEITLKLIPIESAYMQVKHTSTRNLDEVLALLEGKSEDDKYSVAWIDCLAKGKELGRSIVMNGHHATLDTLPKTIKEPLKIPQRTSLSIPFNFPSFFLNRFSVKVFNALIYKLESRKKAPFITDYNRYFYPLDFVGHWNRIYGKKGFIQYQFVLPLKTASSGLEKILSEVSNLQNASFLAVLKRFGKSGGGMLSFPIEGYTLALDIPVREKGLISFLDHLDDLVLKHEGRVYLAKDARMQRETFYAMYPRLKEWQRVKAEVDPFNQISSDLSRRLSMI